MGVFLQPKDTNRIDGDNTKLKAQAVQVIQEVDNEFIPVDGSFDSLADGLSSAVHLRDSIRREAAPNAPLPTGGWRVSVSRNVSSGFGKGNRAGRRP